MLDDGVAVKLNAEKENMNSKVLKFLLVVKVLGNKISFPMCSVELRRHWNKFGNFHMTSLGMNWILCSFISEEAMDEVLNGGPWYVGGYIVGMDKWSTSFNPNSFNGITAPVWIRLPCLPLYCWDEENITRIASKIGVPMYVDGNSFRWGKHEFVRVCIRLNLENSLPKGVWIDGIAGRFFQHIEYEKIDMLCFYCGKVGHDKDLCPEIKKVDVAAKVSIKQENVVSIPT
ncbi:uncharacterized protein LOC110113082 [Dendrobium catenatum]|uniref:uncharacterized protein LOC110113082 n=1 Tax=Dendrobium catenatum TaxID=906689 RepID=UPI0009F41264|nr:uncharacterized protein LOC110113082 [Dendrobium catenatum]